MTEQKRSRDDSFLYAPCHICGSTDFTWGKAYDYGRNWIGFVPDTLKGFAKALGLGKKQMAARECNRCGNIQWFTKEG